MNYPAGVYLPKTKEGFAQNVSIKSFQTSFLKTFCKSGLFLCFIFALLYQSIMSRNTEKNIKKHNDKLHKEQAKVKQAAVSRKEKLKEIVKKYNEQKKEY